MVITIYQGFDNSYVMLGSKDKRFHEVWGNVVKIPSSLIYTNFSHIADWCNNELGEECLFEMD